MQINCQKKGKISILEIKGKMFEEDHADELVDTFHRLLEEGERTFIFDLTGVPATLTVGVNAVVSCRNSAVRRECTIKLAIRGKVKGIYQNLFLDRLFEMYDDVQEALASFAA